MKQLALAFCIMLSAFSMSAQIDSTKKEEQKPKVVYVFDNRDTVKVHTLLYKGVDGTVKWCSPGWEIRVGRAVIGDDKKKYWVPDGRGQEYIVTDGLDDKRRPVKTL